MTRRIGWLSVVAFALLAATFLLKTTGISVDANYYFFIAVREPLGDSATTGKPWLFYVINYGLLHSVGALLGRFQSISLQLFYMAGFAMSLAWVAARLHTEDSRLGALLRITLVAVSLLALLNGTALMMEAAVLPAMTVAVGCAATGATTRRTRVALLVSSAVATAIKATTIPGLILIALAFFARLRGRALLIAAGVTAGLAVNAIGLKWIGPSAPIWYGGIGDLFSAPLLAERLSRTGSYISLWLVLVGVSLAVVTLASPRDAFRDRVRLILASGSLAAVFLLQLVSRYDFARYCYPAMWVALLWILLSVDVRRRGLVATMLTVELVMAVPLFTPSHDRVGVWPTLITRELVHSGGTVLSGLPIYGLAARQLLRDRAPCVWINVDNGERNDLLKLFARAMFPTSPIHVSPVFDPNHDPGCTGSNTIRMWREHVEGPDAGCADSCGPCGFQKMEYFSLKPGWVRNQVCWPSTRVRQP